MIYGVVGLKFVQKIQNFEHLPVLEILKDKN